MDAKDLIIRRMTKDELVLALDWAADEGWNPGLFDAETFHAADPNGFLLGELDGEPIGSVSAVRYGTEFGFLGFYIVKPAYRGQGYGLRLWRAAMDRLGSRNVGLDGVLAQQNTYCKSGFKLAYRNIRHAGVGGGSVPTGLIDLSVVAFNEVVRYDETVFPAPRATFLSRWIRQREGEALGVVGNEGLSGYGVLRACRRGFKIGPLFADDVGVADLLFRGLVSRVTGQSVFLDTPEANSTAIELAKRHRMTPTFETARMYTREPPKSRLDRCFGVTTFELG